MQKRNKPTSPKAGDTVPLVLTRIVRVQNDTPAANELRRGKLNYQAKPKKAASAPKPSAPKTRVRVEQRTLSKGRYIGDGQQLTAFVWLDDENLPVEAANDAK